MSQDAGLKAQVPELPCSSLPHGRAPAARVWQSFGLAYTRNGTIMTDF